MITTTGTNLSVGLAGIFSFIRAVAGDLPDPSGVSVYNFGRPAAHLLFDSLDDLRNWAAYLQVPVASRVSTDTGKTHYNADATWGPVDGQWVEFTLAFIDEAPASGIVCQHPEDEPCVPVTMPRDCDAAEWS